MAEAFRVAIPARYGSSRLPGKPLRRLAGRTLLEHVHRVARASGAAEVVVATDDERIRAEAERFGAEVCMTAADHASGTDRLAEVVRRRGWPDQTVVVNLGARDGLEPGHVFGVFQSGGVVRDPLARDPEMERYERRARERAERTESDTPYAFVQGIGNAVEATSDMVGRVVREFEVATVARDEPWAQVTLPEERAGTIMIYRPFERLSYALVMEATRAINVRDAIKNP